MKGKKERQRKTNEKTKKYNQSIIYHKLCHEVQNMFKIDIL